MKEKIVNKNSIKETFYKTNPRGGISLIVLVITIVVVIILATAVIVSLQNNNPMVEANKARINSDVANMQAIFTSTVGKIMAEKQDVVTIYKTQLNTVTSGDKKAVGIAKYRVGKEVGQIRFDSGNKSVTTYYTGKELPLYGNETKWYIDDQGILSINIGGIKYGGGEQDPDILKDGVTKVGEKVTESAKEYQDGKGKIATIPINFAIVPGKTDISSGLVISDVANDTEDVGNQFVWVPVENIEEFVSEEGYCNGELQNCLKYTSEPINYRGTTASQEEIDEYNNMKASVEEYHGFYIGRYETSNDGNDNVQVKKNKYPWIRIKWGNSVTDLSGGIVEKIRAMYSESLAVKGSAVSTLVYGVAWDETVRFIKKNYPGIEKDSRGYGEYSKGINTGSVEQYSLNNIYDMAGNAWEWTMEGYGPYRTCRSGITSNVDGFVYPLSFRDFDEIDVLGVITGRLQLYIK